MYICLQMLRMCLFNLGDINGAVFVEHFCWCVDYTLVYGVKLKKTKYKYMGKNKVNKRLKKRLSSNIPCLCVLCPNHHHINNVSIACM